MDTNLDKAKKELKKLLDGNLEFTKGILNSKTMNAATLKKYAQYQEPYAAVLSCSDSRAVPEIIFNCGIGELFVIRTAGITVGHNVTESIEYAVKKLKVPLLILLGHDDCGVMKYAKAHYPKKCEDFKSILDAVYPCLALKEDIKCHNFFAKEHTIWVEETLLKNSKIIKNAVENKELLIVKCHLNHDTGRVEIIYRKEENGF